MRAVYWFRDDLRIEDNRVLHLALKNCSEIYPVFFWDENKGLGFSLKDPRAAFLVETLDHLSKQISLTILFGNIRDTLNYIIDLTKPDCIYVAEPFSWTGIETLKIAKELAAKNGIEVKTVFEGFLADFRKIERQKVFSAFYRRWKSRLEVEEVKISKEDLSRCKKLSPGPFLVDRKNLNLTKSKFLKPDFYLNRFNNFDFSKYDSERDRLDLDGTSRLSPLIRYGIVSIRKVFKKAQTSEKFITELCWREFFYHIKYYFPEFKDLEFNEKRRGLSWNRHYEALKKFKEAETGYPIVDAAIRQLKKEYWMHNRARMIVASFLTKDLLIDWREGERFFSNYLLDYDEILNVGNWQWVASVGPDPKPFRIFNPIIQAKKYDPDCRYIIKYLPELSRIPKSALHDPIKYKIESYVEPIVDHKYAAKTAKLKYLNS